MAAAMERDMRDKFLIALALTIPVIVGFSSGASSIFRICLALRRWDSCWIGRPLGG
jgi:hypothetical protein